MRRLASVGFAVLLAISGVSQVWAHGGGGMGGMTENDVCAREKGHYLIHFSAYQHGTGRAAAQLAQLRDVDAKRYLDAMKEEFQSFCRDIPKTGKTTLTFDLVSDALRRIPVAVRVVEAAEGTDSGTVLYIPQQVYPSGVVRAETDFAKAGRYAAIVEVEEHPGRSHSAAAQEADHGSHGGVEAVSQKHASAAEEEAYHAHDSTFSFPFTVGLKAPKSGGASGIVKNAAILAIIGGIAVGAAMYMRKKKAAV